MSEIGILQSHYVKPTFVPGLKWSRGNVTPLHEQCGDCHCPQVFSSAALSPEWPGACSSPRHLKESSFKMQWDFLVNFIYGHINWMYYKLLGISPSLFTVAFLLLIIYLKLQLIMPYFKHILNPNPKRLGLPYSLFWNDSTATAATMLFRACVLDFFVFPKDNSNTMCLKSSN